MLHVYLQAASFPDGNNLQRLGYILEELGAAVHIEPYLPFGAMDYGFLPADEPVLCYGSVAMIADAQRRLRQTPLAYCDWALLRCSSYYGRWGEHLLQRRLIEIGSINRAGFYAADLRVIAAALWEAALGSVDPST